MRYETYPHRYADIIPTPELGTQSAWVDRVSASLEDIGRAASSVSGVPLGYAAPGSRFVTKDLGTTAAFLECCQQAYVLGLPVDHLVREACEWIEQALSTLDTMTANAITHTWESVLSLVKSLRVGECFDVHDFCNAVEPHLQDVAQALDRGQRFPEQAVAELAKATGCNDQLRICFERDIWRSA